MIMILIVPALLALTYFWLIGHWFARVAMAPVMISVLLASVVLLSMATRTPGGAEGLDLIWRWALIAACFPFGWVVSGLPVQYWRQRNQQLAAPRSRMPAR